MLIHNVRVYPNDGSPVVENGAVLIEGARIVAVGDSAEFLTLYPHATRLDGGGKLLMPGFSNVHMHFYGTYARGLSISHPMHNFHEILQYLWWALDKTLDYDAVYYSTLLPAISAVKHGCTSIIDHHASPNWLDGSLDRVEDALTLVGLRGNLCYEVSDRDGKAIRDAGLAENERFMRKCIAAKQANPEHLFDGMMGLHASFTLDDDSLEKAVGIATDLGRGCHIHMLEDFVDQTLTQEKYGRGVVDRLAHFGVLGDKSIAAHGIFLDDAGRQLLADSNTIVVHQAQSNMNNAVGRSDIFALLKAGVTVGIGTDGMTPNLRREIMTGYLLHDHHLADNNAGWVEFEQMAMHNNYDIFQRLSGAEIGRITPNALADIILLDYDPPTPFNSDNFWGHFLYGIIDAVVDTTIINGKIVMQDKQIVGIDEAEANAKSREVAARVWQRFSEI